MVMVETILGLRLQANITEICLALNGELDQKDIAQELLKGTHYQMCVSACLCRCVCVCVCVYMCSLCVSQWGLLLYYVAIYIYYKE